MWHCPNCSNELIWQNDWDEGDSDVDDPEYCFYTMWECSECEIEVTQRIQPSKNEM